MPIRSLLLVSLPSLSVVSNYAFIISFVLLLSSCTGLNNIGITGVEGFAVRGMENNAVSFAADIGVRNPASVGFKVREINLRTTIDGNFIGILTSPDRVKIPAKSDSTYTMNFSLELANLITSASALYNLSRKKQVNVVMQGYVKARSGLMTKKVDVNESRLLDVPQNFR
jgi:LEA14-like dessication related protein